MLPAIIGAIGSIASAVGGSLLTNHQSQKNAAQAYDRQRQLTLDTPRLNVDGMRQAGLSPAMLNGGSFSAASSPAEAQTSPYNLGDPAIFASIAQQLASAAASKADAENKESQNKLNEENTEAQKLSNEKTRNEMAAWQSTHPNYVEYPDGTRFYVNDPNQDEKINQFEKSHPDMAGEGEPVSVLKPQSESAYNALYANSRRDAEISMWRLQKKVNDLKLTDKSVIHALSNMDKAQYNQLVKVAEELHSRKLVDDATVQNLQAATLKSNKEMSLIESNIAFQNFQKKLMQLDYNEKQNLGIGNLVKDFEAKGFSFATLGKLLLSLIASNVHMSLSR